MPGLRSLRNRPAVIFALIILGDIGTIYLSVTPRLEASLTSQRLNGLLADSKRYLTGITHVLPADDPTQQVPEANLSRRETAHARQSRHNKIMVNRERRK